MPSCVFRKCKNYGSKIKKDDGITYHTFPSDELVKTKWVRIVQKERSEHDWLPAKCSSICSAHFQKEDLYTTKNGYVRLKKSAVPVIQSQPVETVNVEEDHRSGSPLSEDLISDTDSIFDTPIVTALKKQLEIKNKKCDSYKRQCCRFRKRAKYFKTETMELRGIVKQLKNRNEIYRTIISKLTETIKTAKRS